MTRTLHAKPHVRLASRLAAATTAAALALLLPTVVLAQSSWDNIRGEVFGQRAIHDGTGVLTLKSPFRPEDQRAVPIGVDARFADGRSIKAIHIIIDENPSPIATVLRPGPNRAHVGVNMTFRFNRKTNVRAIVEASDGELYMQHAFVRYAGGQSACSAPPNGNPEEIAANMGKMKLAEIADPAAGNSTQIHRRARLEVNHPNFTGMQMDQITLLYYPVHIIEKMEIRQGGDVVMQLENGISVSENPVIDFTFDHNGAGALRVVATDTKKAVYEANFPIGPGT
jgi:sulfur-oxidizing protein SoxY